MFRLSVSPEDAPDAAARVTLHFEKGNCVGIEGDGVAAVLAELGHKGDGKKLGPLAVMKALNKLGGKHGIGRVDMVENRFVGMKSRGVYETPGGAILHFAHRQMESLTMDREAMHLRDSLIPQYSTMVYNGFWFALERHALQALVEETQRSVTGEVRVKLYKGNVIAAGRRSPLSLYNPHMATMEADPTQAYNQSDATGFIRLNALRLKVAEGRRRRGAREGPERDERALDVDRVKVRAVRVRHLRVEVLVVRLRVLVAAAAAARGGHRARAAGGGWREKETH
jgi:argininosuccinate synthase